MSDDERPNTAPDETAAVDAGVSLRPAAWRPVDFGREDGDIVGRPATRLLGLGEWAFTTELAVSELVTNGIRYGASPIRLRLIRDDECLICEVSDASSTAPHLRRARVFDEGGRGLLLVAQLTDRWGARHTPTGRSFGRNSL